MIVNVNMSGKNDKPLEENVGEYFHDLRVSGDLLKRNNKHCKGKSDTLEKSKIKTCSSEGTIKRMKKQIRGGEDICNA